MRIRIAVALMVLASIACFAAAQVADTVVADVPFAFHVGKILLPAGTYTLQASSNLMEITVRGKTSAVAPVITRISTTKEDSSSLVFDVVGNDHILSEIYIAGEDGFLVSTTTEKHTHYRVKVKK